MTYVGNGYVDPLRRNEMSYSTFTYSSLASSAKYYLYSKGPAQKQSNNLLGASEAEVPWPAQPPEALRRKGGARVVVIGVCCSVLALSGT